MQLFGKLLPKVLEVKAADVQIIDEAEERADTKREVRNPP